MLYNRLKSGPSLREKGNEEKEERKDGEGRGERRREEGARRKGGTNPEIVVVLFLFYQHQIRLNIMYKKRETSEKRKTDTKRIKSAQDLQFRTHHSNASMAHNISFCVEEKSLYVLRIRNSSKKSSPFFYIFCPISFFCYCFCFVQCGDGLVVTFCFGRIFYVPLPLFSYKVHLPNTQPLLSTSPSYRN